jgi:AAA family ATP:ADP antiporter
VSILDRLLRPFAKVRPGEGALALLMLACVFLILTSYYVMKTAREGLILAGGTFGLDGEELKTYATGAMAIVLAGVVPLYSAIANRVRRIRLINVSYAFVLLSLTGFFVAAQAGLPIGLPFFIWLGLVSVFLISQFWSYATDLYTEDQGKRLFAIIALGGSTGAIVGPKLTALADTYALMVLAAAILVGSLVLFNVIERIHAKRANDRTATARISGAGGFSLVLRDRYLLLIAGLLVVANLVNTTGEYILSTAAVEHAASVVPGLADDPAVKAARREVIKTFYGDFFFWVNLVGFAIQAFLVSRVIEHLGVRRSLFVLPLVALAAYGAIGLIGGFALIRAVKIAENSTDYSLNNTVRQALFLPTDRAVKYKAKAAIDTFFVRGGDLLAALVVWGGIHLVGASPRGLAIANIALVVVWCAIAAGIARRHRQLSPHEPESAARDRAPARTAPAGARA